MKRKILFGFALLFTLGLEPLSAGDPPREILGFNLHMNADQVHARLKKIGTFIRSEKNDEAWNIKDKTFSGVIIGFGKKGPLRYVTGIARNDKDAQRIAYREIGDLNKARQVGDPKIKNFIYQWKLPARGGDPETIVVAMGRDPKYLHSLSLKRAGAVEGEED